MSLEDNGTTLVVPLELDEGVSYTLTVTNAKGTGNQSLNKPVTIAFATGGTLAATINLVEKLGADLVGIAVLIELAFLNGREKFIHENIFSLIEF